MQDSLLDCLEVWKVIKMRLGFEAEEFIRWGKGQGKEEMTKMLKFVKNISSPENHKYLIKQQ